MRSFFLLSLLLFLSSCSTSSKTTKVKLTGCDHYSGWCDQIRDTAEETYLYSQMAANTYKNGYQYLLPDEYELKIKKDNDSIGFAYSIYENQNENLIILSFRGTEGLSFKDWWFGNLLGKQNKRGLKLYDEIKRSANPGTKFIVTGHSLGGGIALEVSLKRENVDAYVFNTSPRFSADGYNIENKRISVVEHGEILKAVRAPFREASQKYTSIGCSTGDPISQHEQVKLSECLTQIAAIQSAKAKSSLELNNRKFIYNEQ